MKTNRFDLVIVGAGLAGSLLFKALQTRHPQLRTLLIEKGSRLSGNRAWCFHDADLPPGCGDWLSDLITKTWSGYRVQFPDYARALHTPYHSLVGQDLHEKLSHQYAHAIRFQSEVESISVQDNCQIKFIGGEILEAETVILARGWDPQRTTAAWQKYVGLNLELMEPHGLDQPVFMDASVPQIDGFRFFHLLPFGPRRVLIEDHYYSHHAGLKTERIEQEIMHYTARRKWAVRQVLGHSQGALPLVLELSKDPDRMNPEFPRIGAESGFFHPVAGLSVPTLLRQITAVSEKSNLSMASIKRVLGEVESEAKVRLRYDRLMNRLLFRASEPTQRYKLLSHFYRMPEPLIERFYAGKMGPFDQMRLMIGRPPVPWTKALRVLREGSA